MFIPSAVNGLQMGRADGHNMYNGKKDTVFTWTDVHEKDSTSSAAVGIISLLTSYAYSDTISRHDDSVYDMSCTYIHLGC